ncbi:MAG: rod shape-determining protein MreC [Rhodothermales bacterium]|jgi:rod shape-determining protein MreC
MIRLWERFADWILLVGLVLVSLVVMISVNQPMIRGLRARALDTSAVVEERLAAAGRYLNALRENDRLREENIRLSSQLALSREADLENDRLRRLLALPDSMTGGRVAAGVVSKDITRQRNTLTISVGKIHGVQVGMAVVDPSGVVGVVDLTGQRFSLVKSFLNPGFKTPVKIQPHLSDGLLERSISRPDLLEVLYVPTTDPVAEGQLVVTSGFSSIFRPGLPIGTIESATASEGDLFWRIMVRPAASISSLQHVFVLLDHPDPDRIILDSPDS